MMLRLIPAPDLPLHQSRPNHNHGMAFWHGMAWHYGGKQQLAERGDSVAALEQRAAEVRRRQEEHEVVEASLRKAIDELERAKEAAEASVVGGCGFGVEKGGGGGRANR
jgi:hypothetical protein